MKMDIKTPTNLILHGHFYQPPRENPLVDIIPKQASAKPYTDWNERIFDDCYRANAYSRYLDGYGQIREIVNNYEYISFNFADGSPKAIVLVISEQYPLYTHPKSSVRKSPFSNTLSVATP